MIHLYKYLFYRLYTWNLKTWGKSDNPQWNALFGVSFMMILNIAVFFVISDCFFDLKIVFGRVEPPIVLLIIIATFVLILNYLLFIHKGKYIRIAQQYKNETKNVRLRNTFLLWAYLILSILINLILIELSKLEVI